jgi:peptide-methionine (S)-S-oxide reductase
VNQNHIGGAFTAAALLAATALIAHPVGNAVGPSSATSGPAPAPRIDAATPSPTGSETAILSGGCFWGVQGVFEHVRGVRKVVAGYAGGAASTAMYEVVSTGATGHAESVLITFDPRQISYGEILRIFFSVATDPTQVDEQYPDQGSQYRSEIFYASPEQERIARAYISQLDQSGFFRRPIATRVDAATGFYPAEAYHQDYLVRHPDQPYIAVWDLPKVSALQTQFPRQFQAAPITVSSQ